MPATFIRWTVGRAASEWGTNTKTLANGLRQLGLVPGTDGKYSTQQIDKALHGDFEAEKTRLTSEQADIARIKKDNLLRINAPAIAVERIWLGWTAQLRQQILNLSELTDARRAEILKDFQAIPTDEYFRDAPEQNYETEEA